MPEKKHGQKGIPESFGMIIGLITFKTPDYFERQELARRGYKIFRHENPCVILYPREKPAKIR